ncbi:unnamed protein product [Orchesella dallaii]|uniref:Uncharacterized protein n=1 Tax=Orchesella dallaii TaxID=48710 RepID=A0ABP1RBM5_9HEXA
MEKTRIKRGNETEFFSDLVWRFNASHNRSTLFDCLHEADWTTGRLKLKSLKQIVGSTVVIKSTENDTYEFGIEITINRNSSVADFHPWNQTKGETCSTNLAFVASNGKVDPMCVDGESELAHSQPCGNLDECDSFSLWHILVCGIVFHDIVGIAKP